MATKDHGKNIERKILFYAQFNLGVLHMNTSIRKNSKVNLHFLPSEFTRIVTNYIFIKALIEEECF